MTQRDIRLLVYVNGHLVEHKLTVELRFRLGDLPIDIGVDEADHLRCDQHAWCEVELESHALRAERPLQRCHPRAVAAAAPSR